MASQSLTSWKNKIDFIKILLIDHKELYSQLYHKSETLNNKLFIIYQIEVINLNLCVNNHPLY